MDVSLLALQAAIEKLDAFLADAERRFDNENEALHKTQAQMQAMADAATKEISDTFDESQMRAQVTRESRLDVLKPAVYGVIVLGFLAFVANPFLDQASPTWGPRILLALLFGVLITIAAASYSSYQRGVKDDGALKEIRLNKITQQNSLVTDRLHAMMEETRKNLVAHEQFAKTIMKGIEARMDNISSLIGPLVIGHVANQDHATRRRLNEMSATELGKDLLSRSKSKKVDTDE
jgi:hypothetical protein